MIFRLLTVFISFAKGLGVPDEQQAPSEDTLQKTLMYVQKNTVNALKEENVLMEDILLIQHGECSHVRAVIAGMSWHLWQLTKRKNYN